MERYPKHPLGFMAQGVILHKLGDIGEAIFSLQAAIKISPNNAIAYNDLGIFLKDAKKFDEAESAFIQAIKLDRKLFQAYSNYGNLLTEMFQYKKSVEFCKKAIDLNPNFAEAHNNLANASFAMELYDDALLSANKAISLNPRLGAPFLNRANVLRVMRSFSKAEEDCRHVISLGSHLSDAYRNLGLIKVAECKLTEAKSYYERAIEIDPGYYKAISDLANVLYYSDDEESASIIYTELAKFTGVYSARAHLKLSILNYVRGYFNISLQHLSMASELNENMNGDFKNDHVYFNYMTKLMNWRHAHAAQYLANELEKYIYIVGDSHTLLANGLGCKLYDCDMKLKSEWIEGCKIWHVASPLKNIYQQKFVSIINKLPTGSHVIISLGEIDCRQDDGITKYHRNNQNHTITEICCNTIDLFLRSLSEINRSLGHKIIIQGVPAPNTVLSFIPNYDLRYQIEFIKLFNNLLKDKSLSAGFCFMDLRKATDSGDGTSSVNNYLDTYHLLPSIIINSIQNEILQPVTI